VNAIVVGTDGSPHAARAVEWAAREAARRELPLRIVNAVLRWAYDTPLSPPPLSGTAGLETQARTLVDRSARAAAGAAPGVAVETAVVDGDAAKVLRDAAATADLMVIGSRGLGGFTGLLLGSVGYTLAGRLPCPLVVVREDHPPPHDEVVVGVDGLSDIDSVLEVAFSTADMRGARLRALHAWTYPASRGPGDMQPLVFDIEKVTQEETRALAETIAGRRGRFPDVDVIEDTVRAPAARALVGASTRADLLVIGPHHPNLRRPGGLGSVAHAVLHHAHCPVVVAPATRRRSRV
jgi:nucleotide-binding universal stress UspA family protein